MKIPIFILSLALAAVFAIQAWTLNTVVECKTEIAAIKAQLQFTTHNISKN